MTQRENPRILALDVGTRRIGLALSDQERRLAQPLCVLERKNRDNDVARMLELIRRHRAGLLVVGLPKKSETELGPSAEKALSLGRRLGRAAGLEVIFVDEFETSQEAEEALLEADLSRSRRREVIDKLAASLILQRYLDGQRENQ